MDNGFNDVDVNDPHNPYGLDPDEFAQLLRDRSRINVAPQQTARDAHFINEIGKWVTPERNTWECYSRTVRESGLQFNPDHYVFDKAIADHFKNRALFDPSDRHYRDLEPLRHNLAVLRNFAINHIYGEQLDPSEARDERRLMYIVQMGGTLGDILNRGQNRILHPLGLSVSPKKANAEGGGAALLYEKLLATQSQNKWLSPLRFFRDIMHTQHFDRRWKLPPIELTPFSALNLSEPPPTDMRYQDEVVMADALPDAALAGLSSGIANATEVDGIGSALIDKAIAYNSVEGLSQPVKTRAIEIARDILEKLKIQYQASPVAAMLDTSSNTFRNTLADIQHVIQTYETHLPTAQAMDPTLRNDPMITMANEAIGVIGAQMKLQALEQAAAAGNTAQVELIKAELDRLPDEWLNANHDAGQLLNHLEQGLNMVVATIHMAMESSMDGQNQRGLALGEGQLRQVEFDDQRKEMQSLAFDQDYQRMAEARRSQQTQFDNLGTPSHGKGKERSSDSLSSSSGSKGFDQLLNGSDMNQMRSSMNAQTSGNFDPLAPGSIQRTIAKETHRGKQDRQQQDQKKRTTSKLAHQRLHAARQDQAEDSTRRRDRDRGGRS